MKNILFILYVLVISALGAQEYDISECIKIALDRKGTLVSAGLEVESANQGVLGSYSGVLPSLSLSTSGAYVNMHFLGVFGIVMQETSSEKVYVTKKLLRFLKKKK